MSKTEETEVNQELTRYFPFAKAIARMFGDRCEVLIHDVSRLEHSIVCIENGHVTGRSVGDPMTDLGLYFLQSDLFGETDFVANYQSETKDGKKLKSTSIFLRNSKKAIIGFLCINYDIAYLSDIGQRIADFCQVTSNLTMGEDPSEKEEAFTTSLDDLFDRVFAQALKIVGMPIEKMQKKEKSALVEILHKRGVFLVNGTIDEVARRINVSKYTIYNYLAEIKAQGKSNKIM